MTLWGFTPGTSRISWSFLLWSDKFYLIDCRPQKLTFFFQTSLISVGLPKAHLLCQVMCSYRHSPGTLSCWLCTLQRTSSKQVSLCQYIFFVFAFAVIVVTWVNWQHFLDFGYSWPPYFLLMGTFSVVTVFFVVFFFATRTGLCNLRTFIGSLFILNYLNFFLNKKHGFF